VLILIIYKLELLSVVTATHSKPLPEISKALVEALNHPDRVEGISRCCECTGDLYTIDIASKVVQAAAVSLGDEFYH
jgi:hypothetical protein